MWDNDGEGKLPIALILLLHCVLGDSERRNVDLHDKKREKEDGEGVRKIERKIERKEIPLKR